MAMTSLDESNAILETGHCQPVISGSNEQVLIQPVMEDETNHIKIRLCQTNAESIFFKANKQALTINNEQNRALILEKGKEYIFHFPNKDLTYSFNSEAYGTGETLGQITGSSRAKISFSDNIKFDKLYLTSKNINPVLINLIPSSDIPTTYNLKIVRNTNQVYKAKYGIDVNGTFQRILNLHRGSKYYFNITSDVEELNDELKLYFSDSEVDENLPNTIPMLINGSYWLKIPKTWKTFRITSNSDELLQVACIVD